MRKRIWVTAAMAMCLCVCLLSGCGAEPVSLRPEDYAKELWGASRMFCTEDGRLWYARDVPNTKYIQEDKIGVEQKSLWVFAWDPCKATPSKLLRLSTALEASGTAVRYRIRNRGGEMTGVSMQLQVYLDGDWYRIPADLFPNRALEPLPEGTTEGTFSMISAYAGARPLPAGSYRLCLLWDDKLAAGKAFDYTTPAAEGR